MIAQLRGVIAQKTATGIVLDVQGVGYDVLCPLTVLDWLPPTGSDAQLCIHTHVREDQITLFGFRSPSEKGVFRLLISISGIGPKLGLACLSGLGPDELSTAIATDDIKRLSSIPGVGKRTAERMVLELKNKVGPVAHSETRKKSSMLDDLSRALKNLGYKDKEVDQLIESLDTKPEESSFEVLLREALSKLRKGNR